MSQTSISAGELNITASEDINTSGVALGGKTVNLTAIKGSVDLGVQEIVVANDSIGVDNARISGNGNLLEAAFNASGIAGAVGQDGIGNVVQGLNDAGIDDIEASAGGGYQQGHSVTNVGTSITADNINISAGKDFEMKAGLLDGKNVNVDAKENVIIDSVYDTEFVVGVNTGLKLEDNGGVDVNNAEGMVGYTLTSKGSMIKGDNINITAGNDMAIIGSQVDGGNVKLDTGRDLLVRASYDLGVSVGVNVDGKTVISKKALQNALNGDMSEITPTNTVADVSVSASININSNSSTISGNNIDISSGRSTTLVSSDIAAKNNVNIDAGKALILLGLPDNANVAGGLDVSIANIDGEYKVVISASSNGRVGDSKSSITAGNEINGGAGYVIISLNGDIESSKGKGVENNFDTSSLLPIVIEEDFSTETGFEASSKPQDVTETINTALDLIELLKTQGAL